MSLDDDLEPSAWPEDPSALRDFDRSFRCPICHDFFDTPKSLSCGHSFCHTCIASNLEFQMQTRTKGGPSCPSCRAEADTRQLQLNHSLAHAVKCFLDARPTLLEAVAASCASQPPVQRSRVRSNAKARLSGNIAPSSTGDEKPTRMTRKRARESTLSKRKEGEETCQDIKIVLEGCTSEAGSDACSSSAGEDSDPDFEPRVLSASRHTPNSRKADPPSDPAQNAMPNRNNCGPPAGKVECPICGGYFPQGETAQKHVEICMVRGDIGASIGAPQRPETSPPSTLDRASSHDLKKLPKLAFRLLKTGQLVENVKRCGLPTTGDGRPGPKHAPREVLEKRYTDLRHEIDRALGSGERVCREDLVRKVMEAERRRTTASKLSAFQPKYSSSTGPAASNGLRSESASWRPQRGSAPDHGSSHEALIRSVRDRQQQRTQQQTAGASPTMPDSTKDAGLEHDSARSSSLHLEACIVIDDGGCEFVADSEEEEDTKEPGDQGSIAFL